MQQKLSLNICLLFNEFMVLYIEKFDFDHKLFSVPGS